MGKRKVLAVVAAGVLVAAVGLGAWYGLRDGGPLPTRGSVRQRWVQIEERYMPVPKSGEPSGWVLLREATEARKVVDRTLWQADVPEARPRPDFGSLGRVVVPDREEQLSEDEKQMREQESVLAQRCFEAYVAQGVIERIDKLAGVRTGGSASVLPPEREPLMLVMKTHLGDLRACARINAARIRLAVAADDLSEFERALRSNMSAARMAASGGSIIDALVGVAMEILTIEAAFVAISQRRSEPWLAAVERELDGGVAGVPLTHNLEGELLAGIDGVLHAHQEGAKGFKRVAIDSVAAVTGAPPLGAPAENVAEMEALYGAVQKLVALERFERETKEPSAAALAKARPRFRLVQLLMPAMEKTLLARDQWRLQHSALRLAIAVERYRLAQGRLPATIDELAPTVLAAAIDPWNGKPIRYRLAAAGEAAPSGYVLYSVGFDGVDQGGVRKPGGLWSDALTAKGTGFDAVLNGP